MGMHQGLGERGFWQSVKKHTLGNTDNRAYLGFPHTNFLPFAWSMAAHSTQGVIMKTPHLFRVSALLALGAFTLAPVVRADADDAIKDEATTFDTDASTQGGAKITDAMADEFTTFAGSEANAQALVTGLRTGDEVTLTSTVNGQVTTTTFTPSTGLNGYGNVFISLALAQQELAAQGITHPTSAEIQAALNGGSITVGTGANAKTVQLSGVLVLRASGEGWGQIAHQLDVKLGRVVSDLHEANERIERNEPIDRDHDVGKPDRDVIPDKVDRPDRPVQIDRPERPLQVDRPDLPLHH
jgi:hypothetical protein